MTAAERLKKRFKGGVPHEASKKETATCKFYENEKRSKVCLSNQSKVKKKSLTY